MIRLGDSFFFLGANKIRGFMSSFSIWDKSKRATVAPRAALTTQENLDALTRLAGYTSLALFAWRGRTAILVAGAAVILVLTLFGNSESYHEPFEEPRPSPSRKTLANPRELGPRPAVIPSIALQILGGRQSVLSNPQPKRVDADPVDKTGPVKFLSRAF